MNRSYVLFISTMLLIFSAFFPAPARAREINILVVAINGNQAAREQWQPTIDYLQNHVHGHHFNLITLGPSQLNQIEKLVSEQKIDFIISQPAIYVDLEQKYGVSKILTLENSLSKAEFGSVLIAKRGSGIHSVKDLRGKRIAGVSKLGFGGWLVGYDEMLESGFDPYKSAREVTFLGTQENVLRSVLDGEADAGVLRTGILEHYFATGYLKRQDVNILNQKHPEGFRELVSTALYPEWAFSRTRKVTNHLAEKVGLAALSIPQGGEVARTGQYRMWTLPYDYQPVHVLMQKLKVGPYENFGEVTLSMIFKQHRTAVLITGTLTMVIFMMSLVILRYNHTLRQEKRERKITHKKIQYMATHDDLTQIPNRRLFYQLLEKALQQAKRDGTCTAIVFLDLDGFKKLNDTFGHAQGDKILYLAARAITENIRESDFAARLGGDEFVCALPRIASAKDAKVIADKIIDRIKGIELPLGTEVLFGASAGLLIAGPHHTDPDQLIKQADALMYAAKKAGKGRYAFRDLSESFTQELPGLA